MDLLLTLLPIVLIVVMLIAFQQPADISGTIGWIAMVLVAFFVFNLDFACEARN